MPIVIIVGVGLFVCALLAGAALLKLFWPAFSRRPEPELGDAFRYVAIAFVVVMLLAFFALLALLPPSG